MNKKMNLDKSNPYYRKCPFCGKEFIADHMSRKFCANSVNQNGSVNSCKDDYHNLNKRPNYHLTKNIVAKQILYRDILEYLFKYYKKTIDNEKLISSGIDINFHLLKRKIKGSEKFALLFLEYGLEPINENEYKIFKHGLSF
jgi:hypothetical protein